MKGKTKRILGYSALGLITALSTQVHAAGYKLEFQSASVLADAGEAAVINDAGTNWYNSAGLVYLPQQVVYSGMLVDAESSFRGNVTAPSTVPPPIGPILGIDYAASGNASSHNTPILPAIHYTMPLPKNFQFGISMAPGWGFAEDYGYYSILRYNLVKIYTRSLVISPSLAYKWNDMWSFGAGPDFSYFTVQSKTLVNTQVPFVSVNDSLSRFTADNWSTGFHVGVMMRYDAATRIGLNYRSGFNMHMSGYSDFAGIGDPGLPGTGMFESSNFKLRFRLPSVTILSAYHDMNPCWALMGTLSYETWSRLNQYSASGYVQPAGEINVVLPQRMHNTLDASIGTHLKIGPRWMFRGSFKYIANPTITENRAVNFPDGAKYGLNIGARYMFTPSVWMDMIYGHVWVKSTPIHDYNPVTGALADGKEKTHIDLCGAQLVWNI